MNEVTKEIREEAFDLEQKFRAHLSEKYPGYMTYSSNFELMLLAALVDVRYGYHPKTYSIYTYEEALPLIKQELRITE